MYANKTKNSQIQFPSKNQAIIITAIDNTPQQDYVIAIGDIVKPQNIRYVSRMSNNRICIFLSSKEQVESLLSTHSTIEVNGTNTVIRRLISPSKRIIISNACPSIPHQVIELALMAQGLKLVSQISFLRAGLANTEYAHVLSFRRQVYVADEEFINIPTTLLINHENTDYRIFINTDGLTCHICKQNGHLAAACSQNIPQNVPINNQMTTNQHEIPPTPKDTVHSLNPTTQPQLQAHHDQIITSQQNPTQSLAIAITPEKNSQTSTTQQKVANPPQTTSTAITLFRTPTLVKAAKKLKRKKTESEESSELSDASTENEKTIKIKEIIDRSPGKFTLTYEQFNSFIENALGSSSPMNIAKEYTTDLKGLVGMIKSLYPSAEKKLKNRLTRIRKKLIDEIIETTSDDNYFQDFESNEPPAMEF